MSTAQRNRAPRYQVPSYVPAGYGHRARAEEVSRTSSEAFGRLVALGLVGTWQTPDGMSRKYYNLADCERVARESDRPAAGA